MTTRLLMVAALAALVALLAAPRSAAADHDTTPSPERSAALDTTPSPERSAALDVPGTEHSLDINPKLGLNGFRLGSRLFGRDGYAGGAWLNGEARRDGFSIDGRLERDGKAHNFKFNAEIDEWLRRAIRWWGALDL